MYQMLTKQRWSMSQSNKILSLILSISMSFLLIFSIGCNQTTIDFKPSPYMDPFPPTEGEGESPILSDASVKPVSTLQWNLKSIGYDKDNSDFHGNYNVTVAILSTGIDYNHEALKGQIVINRSEISQRSVGDRPSVDRKDTDGNGFVDDVVGIDFVDGDGFAYDRHGAGTAVAGIIAAQPTASSDLKGLMKRVSLFPIRYINDNGQTSIAALAAALGAALTLEPDVVYIQNAALNIDVPQETHIISSLLEKLSEKGIPVVLGSGDSPGSYGDSLFANQSKLSMLFTRHNNVIIVQSINENNEKPFLAKHHWRRVITAAPGVNIPTLGLKNTYDTMVSGTAYAAAHVTAALALAISKFGRNNDKVKIGNMRRALYSREGGDHVPALLSLNRGHNKLNVQKFLLRLETQKAILEEQ